MNKFLITTALLLAFGAAPAHAVTITFCGPQTEGGSCEGANEQKVFLNEGHTETSGSGTSAMADNVLLFSVDVSALDTRVDTGGSFTNITQPAVKTLWTSMASTSPSPASPSPTSCSTCG
jgi:hypothetical protein